METWKSVPGFEGLYEVSDQGRVRSLARVETLMMRGKLVERARGARILVPIPGNRGYLYVNLSAEGVRFHKSIARVVLEAFVGPCPADMLVCHGNGVPEDNRLTNLRWDTQSSNMLDAVQHGTANCLRTKYPDTTVDAIRTEYDGKRGAMRRLAAKYGTSEWFVQAVLKGEHRA